MKRLAAAWRVLIGVWAPKSWEYPLETLRQYTTTPIPPPNEWITETSSSKPSETRDPAHARGTMATGAPAEPPATPSMRRKRRPRSGRVMKHLLRARIEAASALSSLIEQLDNGPPDKKVNASSHMARRYGGGFDTSESNEVGTEARDAKDRPWMWVGDEGCFRACLSTVCEPVRMGEDIMGEREKEVSQS